MTSRKTQEKEWELPTMDCDFSQRNITQQNEHSAINGHISSKLSRFQTFQKSWAIVLTKMYTVQNKIYQYSIQTNLFYHILYTPNESPRN